MFKVALSYFFRLKIYTRTFLETDQNRFSLRSLKMLNLNLVNGYIYISNTNALKLYNYTIKKRLMFYFIMISLFKSSSHEKKKKLNTHSSNSWGCQFPPCVKTSQIFQTKVGGSSKLPALLTAAVTKHFHQFCINYWFNFCVATQTY